MAEWGDQWGDLWGGKIVEIPNHEEQAKDRLIAFFKSKQKVVDLIGIYAERWQIIENVFEDLRTLFDLDNAFGDIQDKLGSILGIDRMGVDDTQYRVFLKARAELFIPKRRTVEGLLQLTRALLNDTIRTIGYIEHYPKTFIMTISGITSDEERFFRLFLKHSRPATYNGSIIIVPIPAFG